MKAAVTVLLLLLLIGCEHSSQIPSAVLPSPKQDTTEHSEIGVLTRIGSRTDTTRELDFTWKDSSGKLDSLSEYKGKIVLLNFWATWCEPCQEEIPTLEKIAKNSGDSVAVIGVSLDDIPPALETVKNFASTNDINYQIVEDSMASLEIDYLHEKHGIPQSYVISRDGGIKFVLFGPQSEQTFDSLLARAN